MCLGILNFTKKYSNKALEECCKQAIALNKQKYTFIKNTISVVADDLGEAGYSLYLDITIQEKTFYANEPIGSHGCNSITFPPSNAIISFERYFLSTTT